MHPLLPASVLLLAIGCLLDTYKLAGLRGLEDNQQSYVTARLFEPLLLLNFELPQQLEDLHPLRRSHGHPFLILKN